MNFKLSLLVFCSFVPMGCYANCEKPIDPFEEGMCEDRLFFYLYERMNSTYEEMVKISPNTKAFQIQQKRWLTKINKRCKSPDCLAEAYERRTAELENSWEKRTAALNAAVVRDDTVMVKPFEGIWNSCHLFKGNEICESYVLLQKGKQVCGEWQYWATNRFYSGRLKAKTEGQERANVELICGDPNGEINTECEYEKEPEDRWEKTKRTLSVCGTHLYDDSAKSCNVLMRSSSIDYHYHPMATKQREEFISQSWVSRCLDDR